MSLRRCQFQGVISRGAAAWLGYNEVLSLRMTGAWCRSWFTAAVARVLDMVAPNPAGWMWAVTARESRSKRLHTQYGVTEPVAVPGRNGPRPGTGQAMVVCRADHIYGPPQVAIARSGPAEVQARRADTAVPVYGQEEFLLLD